MNKSRGRRRRGVGRDVWVGVCGAEAVRLGGMGANPRLGGVLYAKPIASADVSTDPYMVYRWPRGGAVVLICIFVG